MIIRLFIFLYIVSQIIFYAEYTFIPKIIGAVLILFSLIQISIKKIYPKYNWPLIVMGLLLLHGILTYAIKPTYQTEVSLPSFLLSHFFLVMVYFSLRIVNSFNVALYGFCTGITINYLILSLDLPYFEIMEWGRLKGTLGNPNFFGFMVNFNVVFLLILKKGVQSKIMKILFWIFIFLGMIFVLKSGSKANIFIFFLILFIHSLGKVDFSDFKSILMTAISLLGITILIYNIFQSDLLQYFLTDDSRVFERIEYINNFIQGKERASQDQIRINMLNYGWNNWTKSPVIGHGYDTFTTNSPFKTYSHNNFIELLYNSGIFGAFFFYSLYFFFHKKYKQTRQFNYEIKSSLISLLAMFLFMETSIVLIDNKVIWLIIMIFSVYFEKLQKNSLSHRFIQ